MMRRLCLLIALGLASAAFAAAAQDAVSGTRISDPAAISQILVGNTLAGTMKETGQHWVEFYCTSGKSIYYFDRQITLGKWRLAGDTVCFRYDWDAYRYEGCYQMYEAGDRSLTMIKTNDPADPATFVSGAPRPGDPLKLESQAHNGCKPEPSV